MNKELEAAVVRPTAGDPVTLMALGYTLRALEGARTTVPASSTRRFLDRISGSLSRTPAFVGVESPLPVALTSVSGTDGDVAPSVLALGMVAQTLLRQLQLRLVDDDLAASPRGLPFDLVPSIAGIISSQRTTRTTRAVLPTQ